MECMDFVLQPLFLLQPPFPQRNASEIKPYMCSSFLHIVFRYRSTATQQ